MLDRLSLLKTILWALVGVLAAVSVVRFAFGLGAVTNLSDAAPWGLWVALDVMAGVALAAGGFVVAAAVYVFHLEQYRPFVRAAILTALLGYAAVAAGLLYDLGLPWHIWHPMIYWQHHSVLFEVALCVMFYLTVLALEFAPAVLEHPCFARPAFQTIARGLRQATLPLVVAGIVLSTLHQSSLGSLFLITPYRLHALWYSPILYVLFFVSAVALGLATLIAESLLSSFFYRHKAPLRLLSGLGLGAAVVLALYALLRLGDLAWRGQLGACFDGSWLSRMFLFEMALSTLIPMALLCVPRVRSSLAGLALCAGLIVAGMVLYRVDVCLVAFARPEGSGYFPTWMEIAVSLGLLAACVLVFLFLVERLRVYDDPHVRGAPQPSYDPATLHNLLPDELAAPRRYSLAALLGGCLAVVFLPLGAPQPVATAALPARAAAGIAENRQGEPGQTLAFAVPDRPLPADAQPASLLVIDGNRDGQMVLFNHGAHIGRMGRHESCALCHHLSLPLDRNTSCFECHRDVYGPTPLFRHESHVKALGGNAGCRQCHADDSLPKTYETSTACDQCHRLQVASAALVPAPAARWHPAPGYVDAMHGLCVNCHEKSAREAPEHYSPLLSRCDHCHDPDRAEQRQPLAPSRP